MAQFLGQVPEQVDALAVDFDAKAGDIETIIAALKARLSQTAWTGTDQQRFEGEWDGTLSTQLRTIAGVLRDTATVARANAEQQRQASS